MRTQKNILSYLLMMVLCLPMVMAQVPNAMNYQGVLRDDNGEVQVNEMVDVRFTILSGGTAEFTETHSGVNTNDFGLINLKIGTQNSSDFSTIDWSTGSKELQVEVDAGSGFEDLGANELLSVPYSLQAANANGTWSENANDLYYENGNVGIGTSSPSSTNKLHLFDSNNRADLRIEDDYPFVEFFTTNPTGNAGLSFSDENGDFTGWIAYDGGDNGLKLTGIATSSISDQLFLGADGNIGIRTSNPDNELEIVHGSSGGFDDNGLKIINEGPNNSNWSLYAQNGNGDLSLYENNVLRGNFAAGTGVYTTTSDKTLKSNLKKVNNVLKDITELKVYEFQYKSDPNEKRVIGIMAQDLIKHFPQFVYEQNNDGGQNTYTVDYSSMSSLAIKAIQEQQVTIETLQAELNAMKAEIQKLKNK